MFYEGMCVHRENLKLYGNLQRKVAILAKLTYCK